MWEKISRCSFIFILFYLTQVTGVKLSIDDSTTLRDLLDLELYKFEEEVKTIVDKSVKEQQMEKVLRDLEKVSAHQKQGVRENSFNMFTQHECSVNVALVNFLACCKKFNFLALILTCEMLTYWKLCILKCVTFHLQLQSWSSLEFEYDFNVRTKTPLLRCSEELIEMLEENQVNPSSWKIIYFVVFIYFNFTIYM